VEAAEGKCEGPGDDEVAQGGLVEEKDVAAEHGGKNTAGGAMRRGAPDGTIVAASSDENVDDRMSKPQGPDRPIIRLTTMIPHVTAERRSGHQIHGK
jgi:hypothetical protein